MSCSPRTSTAGEGFHVSQRSQSTRATMPVDPTTSLRHLEEDVRRDVAAARQRANLLQEEVDSLLTRITAMQASSFVDTQDDSDPVVQQVEAIRQLRQE